MKFTNSGKRKFRMPEKGFSIPESDWNESAKQPIKVKKSDIRYERYKKIRDKLSELTRDYTAEIDKLDDGGRRMTIDALIERVENPIKVMTVRDYFHRVINQVGSPAYGHGKTFNSCLQQIDNFTGKKELHFYNINLRWLNDFRDFLRAKGNADATISIYFRSLRDVFNRAIGEEYCDIRDYPFGKKTDQKKFAISQFKSEANKRSIPVDVIQRIKHFDTSKISTIERKDKFGKAIRAIRRDDIEDARTIFLFSYYAAGMNYNDIARLKWSNIDFVEEAITYRRHKTDKKKTNPAPLTVEMHSYARYILEIQQQITGDDPDDHVFSILHRAVHNDELKINGRIHRQLRVVNASLQEIQKLLKIRTKLTTYVARHSFVTHLMDNKVAPDIVQQIMDHSDISITMQYNSKKGRATKAKATNTLN